MSSNSCAKCSVTSASRANTIFLPDSDCLILATGSKLSCSMRAPAETESFFRMADELHLRVDLARWQTWVFRAIPDHDPAICAHGSNNVGVLWLIPGLIYFALVINLLHDVELDFHGRLLRAAAVPSDFPALLIVVVRIWSRRIGELDMSNLQIILRIARSVRADQ